MSRACRIMRAEKAHATIKLVGKVLVAMSGGVDSAVAALLLNRAGHEVIGAFMRRGQEDEGGGCCSLADSLDVCKVAELIGINCYVLNFADEFSRLRDYFFSSYLKGETPNPCIRCNSQLKFGKLLAQARALGAERIATGHYAQLGSHPEASHRSFIKKGADPGKDQSYFLFSLPAEAIAFVMFPVGHFTKSQVRILAQESGLPVKDKKESQGICFNLTGDYRTLLAGTRFATPYGPGDRRGGHPEQNVAGKMGSKEGVPAQPGLLLDTKGRRLGEHPGIAHFTVGQRRGLGVSGTGVPLYVVKIDAGQNIVILGTWQELERSSCYIRDTTWHLPLEIGSARACNVKTRYRLPEEPARITILPDRRAWVQFDPPTYALAPGQAAVCYDQGVVIGGGWIEA